MPYFSFSLDQNFLNHIKNKEIGSFKITPNKIYFSKNTKLWKILNLNENYLHEGYFKFEARTKLITIKKKILFFLPPSIGLGDAIEYALAIKSIINLNIFLTTGVAFVGKYKYVFEKLFKIKNIYEYIIDKNSLDSYDTLFHVSLEIYQIKKQKYFRTNIEKNLVDFFGLSRIRIPYSSKIKNIEKITIFPISNSPIRTMSIKIIQGLINELHTRYKLEFILDKQSIISDLIEKKIDFKSSKKLFPKNIEDLTSIVKFSQFGIYMDSGPLHIAKIFQKKGILIETSVNGALLLDEFNTIKIFKNKYKSLYCNAPCGLTNIYNYNNKSGCYQTLKINNNMITEKNLNSMQRGNLKLDYINFILKPVGCIQNINVNNLLFFIKEQIKN